jgi:hypothetical protein
MLPQATVHGPKSKRQRTAALQDLADIRASSNLSSLRDFCSFGGQSQA